MDLNMILGGIVLVFGLAVLVFWLWQLIRAISDGEWKWVVAIIFLPVAGALFYWVLEK